MLAPVAQKWLQLFSFGECVGDNSKLSRVNPGQGSRCRSPLSPNATNLKLWRLFLLFGENNGAKLENWSNIYFFH